MARRLLVLAGSFSQADRWCRENRIPTSKYVYISDAYRVRGYDHDTNYVVIGTFYDKREAPDILAVVKHQGYQFVDATDAEAVQFALAT